MSLRWLYLSGAVRRLVDYLKNNLFISRGVYNVNFQVRWVRQTQVAWVIGDEDVRYVESPTSEKKKITLGSSVGWSQKRGGVKDLISRITSEKTCVYKRGFHRQ